MIRSRNAVVALKLRALRLAVRLWLRSRNAVVALKLCLSGSLRRLVSRKQERRGGIETALAEQIVRRKMRRSRNAVVALKR